MRRDDLWLADIVDSAGAIEAYTAGLTLEAFLTSDMVRDAVLMRLVGIGEACAAVSADVKERHPEVPWQKVKDFRNLAVHAYFSVDWPVVWGLASRRVPELAEQVARILDEE